MRDILTSFWINIVSSIVFGIIAVVVATYPFGMAILNSLGIGLLVVFVVLTAGFFLRGRNKQARNESSNLHRSHSKQILLR